MLTLYYALVAAGVVLAYSVAKPDEGMYCFMPYGQPVIATHYSDTVRLKVNWLFDQERAGEAWSEWEVGEDNVVDCEIWVHRPEQAMGDPDMDALGHEVLHCLIGEFHEDDKELPTRQ